MEGVAEALVLLATSETIGNGREAISYLGNRLTEHHRAAREAFDEVFEAMKDGAPDGDRGFSLAALGIASRVAGTRHSSESA